MDFTTNWLLLLFLFVTVQVGWSGGFAVSAVTSDDYEYDYESSSETTVGWSAEYDLPTDNQPDDYVIVQPDYPRLDSSAYPRSVIDMCSVIVTDIITETISKLCKTINQLEERTINVSSHRIVIKEYLREKGNNLSAVWSGYDANEVYDKSCNVYNENAANIIKRYYNASYDMAIEPLISWEQKILDGIKLLQVNLHYLILFYESQSVICVDNEECKSELIRTVTNKIDEYKTAIKEFWEYQYEWYKISQNITKNIKKINDKILGRLLEIRRNKICCKNKQNRAWEFLLMCT